MFFFRQTGFHSPEKIQVWPKVISCNSKHFEQVFNFLVFNTCLSMHDGNSFCYSEFGKTIKQST